MMCQEDSNPLSSRGDCLYLDCDYTWVPTLGYVQTIVVDQC